MASNELKAIEEAASGLLYPSESDAPFELVSWESDAELPTTDTLRRQLQLEPEVLIEVESLETFFNGLTEEQAWHDDEDKQMVQRYRKLLDTLKAHLMDLRVFMVGQTEIDIYVIGRTTGGKLAGIKTMAVQT